MRKLLVSCAAARRGAMHSEAGMRRTIKALMVSRVGRLRSAPRPPPGTRLQARAHPRSSLPVQYFTRPARARAARCSST
jgi:hypothetical protein